MDTLPVSFALSVLRTLAFFLSLSNSDCTRSSSALQTVISLLKARRNVLLRVGCHPRLQLGPIDSLAIADFKYSPDL